MIAANKMKICLMVNRFVEHVLLPCFSYYLDGTRYRGTFFISYKTCAYFRFQYLESRGIDYDMRHFDDFFCHNFDLLHLFMRM